MILKKSYSQGGLLTEVALDLFGSPALSCKLRDDEGIGRVVPIEVAEFLRKDMESKHSRSQKPSEKPPQANYTDPAFDTTGISI